MADTATQAAPVTIPDPAVALGQEQADIKASDAAQADLQKQREAALAPQEQGVQQSADELTKKLNEPIPKFTPPVDTARHMNPKEMSDAASIFMTLGALGGLFMRQPMTAALGAMTASMQGVMDKDQQQFDEASKKFKESFDQAMKVHEQVVKERQDIINDKRMDLTTKINMLDLNARKFDIKAAYLADSLKTRLEVDKALVQAGEKAKDRAIQVQKMNAEIAHWHAEESRVNSEAMKNTLSGKIADLEKMLKTGEITREEFDQARGALLGGRSAGIMAQQGTRLELAANQIKESIKSIVTLPATASTGWFGGREQGGGLMAANKETLTNKMTAQEVQSYQLMATGIQRNLASLEAGGVATGLVGLSNKMESIVFHEGDTEMTKLQKLAEIRQIATSAMDIMAKQPMINKQQRDQMATISSDIKTMIPFTQPELNELISKSYDEPKKTFAELMAEKRAANPSPTPVSQPTTIAPGWTVTVRP